jgi:hypothetical protein
MYSYTLYGLHVQATLPLPELPSVPTSTPADVKITLEDLSPVPDSDSKSGLYVSEKSDEVRYHWTDFGSFVVRSGREILYDPLPGVSENAVRLPLLGVVMGTLLHQRGFFTLHASAVSINDNTVAFIGQKGAGKSTIAAAFHTRGHPLITDDVLALDPCPEGSISVLPAFPQIKLLPDAAQALNCEARTLQSSRDVFEKRLVDAAESFISHPAPLKHIYLLAEGPQLNTDQLTGGMAFKTLMSQTYAPRFLGPSTSTAHAFKRCQQIASTIPLSKLTRPLDFSQLNDVLNLIEQQCCLEEQPWWTEAAKSRRESRLGHMH